MTHDAKPHSETLLCSLRSAWLQPDHVVCIVEALDIAGDSELEELQLGINNVGDAGAIALATALRSQGYVTHALCVNAREASVLHAVGASILMHNRYVVVSDLS